MRIDKDPEEMGQVQLHNEKNCLRAEDWLFLVAAYRKHF